MISQIKSTISGNGTPYNAVRVGVNINWEKVRCLLGGFEGEGGGLMGQGAAGTGGGPGGEEAEGRAIEREGRRRPAAH